MTGQQGNHPIQTMCDVLDMPRSTYYSLRYKTESNRESENNRLTERMTEIHTKSKQRYGAIKIHKILLSEGFHVSIKRVQRLMKQAGIQSIIVKKFRPTPSQEKVVERENILKRDFSTTAINEKWAGDITYIHTLKNGWTYLASVMDLHTKKIVGYSYGRSMTTDLVLKALENACVTQNPGNDLIFHSDLGSQYTSEAFEHAVKSHHITHSFSNKGSPYDNACIESFHAILKKEEVNHVQYIDYHAAKFAMFQFIESWYNRERIHGSIGYITPQESENMQRQAA